MISSIENWLFGGTEKEKKKDEKKGGGSAGGGGGGGGGEAKVPPKPVAATKQGGGAATGSINNSNSNSSGNNNSNSNSNSSSNNNSSSSNNNTSNTSPTKAVSAPIPIGGSKVQTSATASTTRKDAGSAITSPTPAPVNNKSSNPSVNPSVFRSPTSPSSELPKANLEDVYDDDIEDDDDDDNPNPKPPIPSASQASSDVRRKQQKNDFLFVATLGSGTFGKVALVRHIRDQKLYAMKKVKKEVMDKMNQKKNLITEKAILLNIQSPFLTHLYFSFQDSKQLYFIIDYCGGGEMFYWLKEHLVFSETRAKLYIAEIAIGITALHDANIIYRDMKAENLMLDLAGHVRITDFGLTKEGVEGYADEGKPTLTFCGTPEYMAPEVITASHTKRGYGKAVDWWGVGTFLYEMLYGQPPFYDKQQDVMMRKITSGTLTFKDPQVIRVKDKEIPINPSSSAKKILKGFLERDPRKRLGCGGLDEIKKHQFFRDMDFRVVAAKGIRPDFVPPSKQDGVQNFEPCKDDDFDDSGTLATSEQNKVQDWSYMGAP